MWSEICIIVKMEGEVSIVPWWFWNWSGLLRCLGYENDIFRAIYDTEADSCVFKFKKDFMGTHIKIRHHRHLIWGTGYRSSPVLIVASSQITHFTIPQWSHRACVACICFDVRWKLVIVTYGHIKGLEFIHPPTHSYYVWFLSIILFLVYYPRRKEHFLFMKISSKTSMLLSDLDLTKKLIPGRRRVVPKSNFDIIVIFHSSLHVILHSIQATTSIPQDGFDEQNAFRAK